MQLFALINTAIFAPAAVAQVLIGFGIYLVGQICRSKALRKHGKELAMAADQNMNVIWLGDPDETISSRIGRAIRSGKAKWYIRFVLRPFVDTMAKLFGDRDHCLNAIEPDEVIENEIWPWQSKD